MNDTDRVTLNPRNVVSLLLSFTCMASMRADAAVMRFRASSQVGTGMVRVGDVADVSDADEGQLAKLRGVTLVPAPAAGRSVRVDYELVRSRLTAQGIDVSPIEFTGKSVVLVSGSAIEKPAAFKPDRAPTTISDSVREAAGRRVSQAVSGHVVARDPRLGKVAVSLSLSSEQVAWVSRPNVQLDVTGGSAPWTGDQQFLLKIREPRGSQSTSLACKISPLAQFVQVVRVVRAGQILKAGDVALTASSDESTERRTLLDDVSAAVGMEVQRTLRPGEPVAAQDLKKVVLVHRGNPVTVVSRVGSITVSLVGKADSDGAAGDTVTVSTLDRKQKLTAWVTGYHEVSVTPPKSQIR